MWNRIKQTFPTCVLISYRSATWFCVWSTISCTLMYPVFIVWGTSWLMHVLKWRSFRNTQSITTVDAGRTTDMDKLMTIMWSSLYSSYSCEILTFPKQGMGCSGKEVMSAMASWYGVIEWIYISWFHHYCQISISLQFCYMDRLELLCDGLL